MGPLFEFSIDIGLAGFNHADAWKTIKVMGFNRQDAQRQARALLRGITYHITSTKQRTNAHGVECIEDDPRCADRTKVLEEAYGQDGEATF